MSRFPISMRILLAAITVLVIFAAVCFASNPSEAVLAAKGVLKPALRAANPPQKVSQFRTNDRNASSTSSATLRHAKARALKSQEPY
jgi:hypothetical protein